MLTAKKSEIRAERSTRKEPLSDSDAAELLDAAREVLIARGRSLRRLAAGEATLDDLKGPTGNYRAPMILSGGTLLVGFNAEALGDLV